jgi:hypothetical protein
MSIKERSSRDTHRDSWFGGVTWTQASNMALNGDLEGARRLAPAVLQAASAVIAGQPRLDPEYRVDGGRWIDIARYVRGEPECWGDMVESEPIRRKGVAIVINIGAPNTVLASAFDRVGISLGSAILGLQALGYAVTVYASKKSAPPYRNSNSSMLISAPLNPGGSPLDVSRLSAILRPWFLRRILFSLLETFPDDIRSEFGIPGGYGQSIKLNYIDCEKITGLKTAVMIDIADAVKHPAGVSDKILSQIKGA